MINRKCGNLLQITTATASAAGASTSKDEVLCVSDKTFVAYEKLQNKLKEVCKESEPLITNVQVKHRLDLQILNSNHG